MTMSELGSRVTSTYAPDVTERQPDWVRKAARHNADPLAAARALRPLIEAGAATGEHQRRLTDEIARGLIEAGMFGLLVPREFGGSEVDAATYIDVIEELSYADGSTGWVVLATTYGIATAAAWLPQAGVEAMFSPADGYICAGQLAPTGKAWRVDGGYRVSGRFQFASGSQLAGWMFGAFVLMDGDKPAPREPGKAPFVWCYAPRRRWKLLDNSWDVMGLAATGSVDYEIKEEFIGTDFVLDQSGGKRLRGGPMYEVGVSVAHVSWSLGVAKRLLDEIKNLAHRKRRPGRPSLIDQPTFQRDFGEQIGNLEAARALVRSAFSNWEEAAKHGKPSLEVKAQARLAACWATKTCAAVGQFAYLAAGSDGARNGDGNNVMQRAFRDLHVGSTHKHVDENVLIDCASVLLGVNDPALVI